MTSNAGINEQKISADCSRSHREQAKDERQATEDENAKDHKSGYTQSQPPAPQQLKVCATENSDER
jgi:hypothetical protein